MQPSFRSFSSVCAYLCVACLGGPRCAEHRIGARVQVHDGAHSTAVGGRGHRRVA